MEPPTRDPATLEDRLAALRRRRRTTMLRAVMRFLGWSCAGLLVALWALLIVRGP